MPAAGSGPKVGVSAPTPLEHVLGLAQLPRVRASRTSLQMVMLVAATTAQQMGSHVQAVARGAIVQAGLTRQLQGARYAEEARSVV